MLDQEKVQKLQIDISQAKKLLIEQIEKQLEMLDQEAEIIESRKDALKQILTTLINE